MRKLTLVDAGSVHRAIRAASKASLDQQVIHKLHCVLLVGLGRSCQEVAGWFGDCTRSVERWVGVVNRLGVQGLTALEHGGRTTRLTTENALRVAFEVTQPPRFCGFSDDHWRGQLLMQHLKIHYGIALSLRQCQRKLRGLRTRPKPD
jgi:transposase